MSSIRPDRSSRSSNVLAAGVFALSLLVFYASYDPVPAGEEIPAEPATASLADFVIRDSVPLPRDVVSPAGDLTPGAVTDAVTNPATDLVPDPATGTPDAGSYAVPSGEVPGGGETSDVAQAGWFLNNHEALEHSVFLLKDGIRHLEGISRYSTVFTKQERIGGDLSEVQKIELKVQHAPHFSVYMKWKNGDTGRQVLYSEAYDDRQMVVKLGGLKGRLLPALKLDPNGSTAMSEARYPVTEAGLLGMLRQILLYREADLQRGYGVTCRRLPNQQFDERECLCLQFDYESPEISAIYRRTILLLDQRHHFPVMARSFTWARDAEGISPAELDEQTLIENYTFSAINVAAELVAEDFSRDNPRYRM